MTNQDLQAVLKYLHSQKINIDSDEFQFQLESHPDYPTLLSFVDTLDFFNIPNVATKIDFENIDNLPDDFVVLLGKQGAMPYLFHLKKEKDYFWYNDETKIKKIYKSELLELWRDVILLVEKPYNDSLNTSYFSKKKILFFLLLILILFIIFFFSQSIILSFFSLLSAIGIYLSIEALKTELGIESKISQSFCNSIANADCSQVINSQKSKLLSFIKFSDISIWFFTSQLLGAFLFSIQNNINYFIAYSFLIILLSIPVTIYSIYFQYKIEKKWCPICLSIILTIYLQFSLILFNIPSISFSITSLILFSFAFLLTGGMILFIKPVFIQRKFLKEEVVKNTRVELNLR